MKAIFHQLITLSLSMLLLMGTPALAMAGNGRHDRDNRNNPNWVRDGKKKDSKKSSKNAPNWTKERKNNRHSSGDPNWVKDRKKDKWDKKDKKDKNLPNWTRNRYSNSRGGDYYKPSKGKRPGKDFNKGYGHDNGNHYGWRKPPKRPHRPHCYQNSWYRPPRPHGWKPGRYRGPRLSEVLGITFGTVISNTINRLLSSGYYVDGYDNDMVFLRDVPVMNYRWPDATFYCGNQGFRGSSFYYSTPGRNLGRYNSLYNRFYNSYGPPASYYNRGGSMEATWWTGSDGFITLNFSQRPSPSGSRFYTTLTLGN